MAGSISCKNIGAFCCDDLDIPYVHISIKTASDEKWPLEAKMAQITIIKSSPVHW